MMSKGEKLVNALEAVSKAILEAGNEPIHIGDQTVAGKLFFVANEEDIPTGGPNDWAIISVSDLTSLAKRGEQK